MTDSMQREPRVIHPLLIGVYPAIALYAHSAHEVVLKDVLPALLASLAFALVVLAVTRWVFGSASKAGAIASLIVVLCFAYGHAFQVAEKRLGGNVHQEVTLMIWALVLLGAVVALAQLPADLGRLTRALNYAAAVLLAMPLVRLGVYELSAARAPKQTAQQTASGVGRGDQAGPPRDIYYLIFDRYGNARTLDERYGFNNQPFLDGLRERGFYVADDSYSNYHKTAHSLASSLNMTYLDELAKSVGGPSDNRRPVLRMLKDFVVARELKRLGYAFVQLGSWWAGTSFNDYADKNWRLADDSFLGSLSEFNTILLKTTVAWPISTFFHQGIDDPSVHCDRVRYKLTKLRSARIDERPTFVFAHFLVPHPPYVFDGEGRCMDKRTSRARGRDENYLGQIEFINGEIIKLVDDLLKREPQPIIVLQADEGPHPERYFQLRSKFDWRESPDDELRYKLGILNAYYLPGADTSVLYPSISPINSFRVILSQYFGEDLPLLPDRHYAYVDEEHLYDFFEVTERLK